MPNSGGKIINQSINQSLFLVTLTFLPGIVLLYYICQYTYFTTNKAASLCRCTVQYSTVQYTTSRLS